MRRGDNAKGGRYRESVCERYREERAHRPYAMNPDESLGSEKRKARGERLSESIETEDKDNICGRYGRTHM